MPAEPQTALSKRERDQTPDAATTRPRRRGRGWRCLVSSSRKPVLEGSLRALDGCGGVIGRPATGGSKNAPCHPR